MQKTNQPRPLDKCWEVYFDSFGKVHVAPLSIRFDPSQTADAYRLQQGLLFLKKADAALRAAALNEVLSPYLYGEPS